MRDLAGRNAVVTGAASGIGLATARRLGAAGMAVVLADIEIGPLEEAVAGLSADGVTALGVRTDVSDPASVEALADAAEAALGRVHVLVNNAGVGNRGRSWDTPLEDWHWVHNVCFWGVAHGLASFVPRMIAHGEEGHIVNTSSMAGLGCAPGGVAYQSAKHAVTAMTEGLFFDLAEAAPQLGVSLLCPGYTRTRIRLSRRNHPSGDWDPGAVAPADRETPPGVEPEVIAELALAGILERRFYLLADRADWEPVLRGRFDAILAGEDPVAVQLWRSAPAPAPRQDGGGR